MKRNRPRIDMICEQCTSTFSIERYRVNAGEGRFCSHQCYAIARGNSTKDKFWQNTTKRETDCLEWKGKPFQRSGYGRVRVNGKEARAHRHAYELSFGPIPDGKMVLHRCDNPICVNPDHLFLGDGFDNMQDMARKGRAAGSRRSGEHHPMAKLTQRIVEEYRARWIKRGRYGNGKILAAELGISYIHFVRVMNGKTCWK